jgi:hypothetical protein
MTPYLTDALALIGPTPERKNACAAMITERVALLHKVHQYLEALPSPGNLKEELKGIGEGLERIKTALEQHSEFATALIFWKDSVRQKGFLAELDELIDSTKFHRDAIVVQHGRQPWDNLKALTAKFAFELLHTFGTKKPTKTAAKDGGAFFGLANLLFKMVTGKKADLKQYCCDVLDHAGDSRIEPGVVARVPFEY